MELEVFVRGLLLGFSIAAPVGPIGVLCIRRALTDGRGPAFVSGLGAATADALYGCLAGFGLTIVSGLLLSHHLWLRSIGGAYLCYLGLKTLVSAPADSSASGSTTTLLGAYASTFFLTITNPMTIFSFLAIFASFGLGDRTSSYSAAIVLVLGVFLGSALWWLLLSGGVAMLRTRLNLRRLRWINTISGGIILGFGLLALVSLIGLPG